MALNKKLAFFFLLPASAVYLLFFVLPAVWAIFIGFFDWSGFNNDMRFIGIDNYVQLIDDQVFIISLKNTLLILVIGAAIIFPLTFTLSSMINSGIRGKRLFRAMIFLPNVVATIALTTLWNFIYNTNFGLLRSFLQVLGLEKLSRTLWTAPENIFWAMLVGVIWINIGFQLILILAGMDKIPSEFFEAAKIEGAGQIKTFFLITLPLMWDVVTVSVVIWTISALKLFEFPFAFIGIYPPLQVHTLSIYLYIMGFGKRDPIYRLGYASAIGVILLLIVVITFLAIRRIMRREVYQY